MATKLVASMLRDSIVVADADDGVHFKNQMYEFTAQIMSLIEDDNKPELVQLLRSKLETAVKHCDKNEMQLSDFVMSHCIKFSAVNCLLALLRGETGLTLELNKPGLYPLHGAAGALSPKMTKFFLKIGVPATCRITDCRTDYGLLPIDFAVQAIRRRVYWTQEESLLSLLADLTGERMIEPLETLRLLFSELSESEVSEVFSRYAAEAKIIEMAILLLVSSEKSLWVNYIHMRASDVTLGKQMTLRQYVVNEVVMLENKVRKIVDIDETKLEEYMEMKNRMMSILMLVEIFLRTNCRIMHSFKLFDRSYPAVAKTIGRVFENSGFKLTGEDTSYIEKPLFLEILLDSVARRSRLRSAASSFKVEDDLQSGFRQDSFETMPDFGWDDADPEHQKLLPMRESLKKLSLVIHKWRWTPNQSVFKLIIMLCLPKMKEILGTANLIPQNSEKINEIACWYAKEGKLIELAIILMLALEKVKDPIIFQIKGESSKRCITLQQFINSELAQAIDLEYRLIGRTTKQERNLSKLCKQKKFTMLSALTLLEIFEKAGLAIEAYLRSERKNVQKEEVIKHISNLLLEAGFKLKSKDIELCNEVDCSPEVTSEVRDEVMEDQVKNSGVLLNLKNSAEMAAESGGQRQDTKRLSYVLPGGFVESSAAHDRAHDMRKFLFARYPAEYPVLPSSAQSFRAFWTSKASKACYCTGIPKAMEVQPRDSVRAANQLLRKFAASKKVVSVTLAVKRRLKYA